MITLIATIHIIACLLLIVLVVMQDSKGGGMFTSQTSSNSVLGATGATSLVVKLTKFITIVLAITCIGLAMISAKSERSVLDGVTQTAPILPSNPEAAPQTPPSAVDSTANPQAPANNPPQQNNK